MISIRVCLSLIFLAFCSHSFSEIDEISGNVLKIRSHDLSLNTDGDWVQIDNASDAGACRKVAGRTIFSFKGDERGSRHLSILLSAKMAGKAVTIGYDDVGLNDYYCVIRYVDI